MESVRLYLFDKVKPNKNRTSLIFPLILSSVRAYVCVRTRAGGVMSTKIVRYLTF